MIRVEKEGKIAYKFVTQALSLFNNYILKNLNLEFFLNKKRVFINDSVFFDFIDFYNTKILKINSSLLDIGYILRFGDTTADFSKNFCFYNLIFNRTSYFNFIIDLGKYGIGENFINSYDNPYLYTYSKNNTKEKNIPDIGNGVPLKKKNNILLSSSMEIDPVNYVNLTYNNQSYDFYGVLLYKLFNPYSIYPNWFGGHFYYNKKFYTINPKIIKNSANNVLLLDKLTGNYNNVFMDDLIKFSKIWVKDESNTITSINFNTSDQYSSIRFAYFNLEGTQGNETPYLYVLRQNYSIITNNSINYDNTNESYVEKLDLTNNTWSLISTFKRTNDINNNDLFMRTVRDPRTFSFCNNSFDNIYSFNVDNSGNISYTKINFVFDDTTNYTSYTMKLIQQDTIIETITDQIYRNDTMQLSTLSNYINGKYPNLATYTNRFFSIFPKFIFPVFVYAKKNTNVIIYLYASVENTDFNTINYLDSYTIYGYPSEISTGTYFKLAYNIFDFKFKFKIAINKDIFTIDTFTLDTSNNQNYTPIEFFVKFYPTFVSTQIETDLQNNYEVHSGGYRLFYTYTSGYDLINNYELATNKFDFPFRFYCDETENYISISYDICDFNLYQNLYKFQINGINCLMPKYVGNSNDIFLDLKKSTKRIIYLFDKKKKIIKNKIGMDDTFLNKYKRLNGFAIYEPE